MMAAVMMTRPMEVRNICMKSSAVSAHRPPIRVYKVTMVVTRIMPHASGQPSRACRMAPPATICAAVQPK